MYNPKNVELIQLSIDSLLDKHAVNNFADRDALQAICDLEKMKKFYMTGDYDYLPYFCSI